MKSDPPISYKQFIERYPHLGEAWESIRRQEESGPLSERDRRLIKLGIAIGAQKEGAVHSAARKARGAGLTLEEILQVVSLAASTVGLPPAVAAFTWVRDVVD